MADETRYEEDSAITNINKKYTYFVIDGSEAMFEAEGSEECDFKTALKLVFNEVLNVCCNKSLTNQIGIIVTNTESCKEPGLDNCQILLPLGIPTQDEVNEIKNLLDDENVALAFQEYSDGFKTCDLANVFHFCKRQFASFSNTRHQTVVYLTNNRNPFGRDDFWESSYFKRTKAAISKLIGNGQRKTLGEFSVILVPTDAEKPQTREERKKEPWYNLDSEVFSEECDAARRLRQKTTATRSYANLAINLGNGVSFDVGVFLLVSEARTMPHTQKYLKSNEMPIEKNVGYVAVGGGGGGQVTEMEEEVRELRRSFENVSISKGSSQQPERPDMSKEAVREMLLSRVIAGEGLQKRSELKKAVELGGEKIILSQEEYNAMNNNTVKGMELVGFCPIDAIDIELSVVTPKFVRPNEETTLGSTRIYRALLDRCFERQQAIVCKYQSRKNEKLRIVALIPWKKGEAEESDEKKPNLKQLEKLRAEAEASEFLHEGFHIVSLPFREEIREDKNRFVEGAAQWPEIEQQDKEAAKNFIKKLLMSYNPTFYENPRLLSQKSALVHRATGDEIIERKDTIAPYHRDAKMLKRVETELNTIISVFSLDEVGKSEPKKRAGEKDDEGSSANKRTRRADEFEGQSVQELVMNGKLAKMTKDQLFELIEQNIPNSKAKKSMKKQDLIDLLTQFVAEN